jgi:hypothetical protein
VTKPISEQQQTITDLKQEIMILKSILTNTQKNVEDQSLQVRVKNVLLYILERIFPRVGE